MIPGKPESIPETRFLELVDAIRAFIFNKKHQIIKLKKKKKKKRKKKKKKEKFSRRRR